MDTREIDRAGGQRTRLRRVGRRAVGGCRLRFRVSRRLMLRRRVARRVPRLLEDRFRGVALVIVWIGVFRVVLRFI